MPQAIRCKAAPVQQHATYTETGWEVFPQGLTDTLTWVRDRYGNPPVYITENGSAFYDPPTAENGVLDDPLRVNYQKKHLAAVSAAIAQGCDMRGYMAWSLLDNLEWSLGFSKRFGIVHVDFATQTAHGQGERPALRERDREQRRRVERRLRLACRAMRG